MSNRPSLEQALDDPRTPQERRAEEAAAEQARIEAEAQAQAQQAQQQGQEAEARRQATETMVASLPPGWRFLEENGYGFVLDPNGDTFGMVDDALAPQQIVGLATAAHAQQAEGEAAGIYAPPPPPPAVGNGTPAAPVQATAPGHVDAAAGVTNPSPTPAQAEAGNYAQGRVNLHGIDIAIETPRGATRSGTDPDGQPWSVTMPDHYGRIRQVPGADGDEMDVYLGPGAEDASLPVFVVDQVDHATGRFDEHKVMMGYATEAEAQAAYDQAFNDGNGPARRISVTTMDLPGFKAWMASGRTKKPLNPEAVRRGILARNQAKAASQPKAPPAGTSAPAPAASNPDNLPPAEAQNAPAVASDATTSGASKDRGDAPLPPGPHSPARGHSRIGAGAPEDKPKSPPPPMPDFGDNPHMRAAWIAFYATRPAIADTMRNRNAFALGFWDGDGSQHRAAPLQGGGAIYNRGYDAGVAWTRPPSWVEAPWRGSTATGWRLRR